MLITTKLSRLLTIYNRTHSEWHSQSANGICDRMAQVYSKCRYMYKHRTTVHVARAVDILMVQANRIYILMITVNKLFSFFIVVFSERNRKHVHL